MFPSNAPVGAQAALKSYIANEGLGAFPEATRLHFEAMNAMPVFEALTTGTERLYAALREDVGLPNAPAALYALGSMAQAAGEAQLSAKADRWWAICAWAANSLAPPPEGVETPEPPEVDAAFTYTPPPEPEPEPVE